MGYKGRITGITFVAIIIIVIRTFVKIHFGATPHSIPLPAIILMIIGWYLGREYDKSVYKANRDPLTGLFNRRYVLDNIQKSFSKANRKSNKLAIILLDVNDFKQINDNFGHETGDQVLKCISDLLIDSFLSEDIVARWGGDEFLIVSPFADEKRLNQKISHFKNSLKSKDLKYNGLSVSIGKAIYPSDDNTFESLISKADANMYRFKSHYNSNT
ncbi:GGDEF domain-containing protein [Virgibacillus sp. SK37]|uniref:GGDEF domain-containing protein n=1 Tax=Virgibacillus sp. SK37 TaxID=403957 RepID=UPI0004D1A9F9|nr:GGDEF domain-containing protein [Virgibacillus sp. SK37]AIF45112.1 hypothetical protein X953_01655 [Virgibacillus sp. SK37]